MNTAISLVRLPEGGFNAAALHSQVTEAMYGAQAPAAAENISLRPAAPDMHAAAQVNMAPYPVLSALPAAEASDRPALTRWQRAAAIAAVGFATGGALVACGLEDSRPVAVEQTCFTELTPRQHDELLDFMDRNRTYVDEVVHYGDGTSDVCVIDNRGTMHHYNDRDRDRFNDYRYYNYMAHQAYGRRGGHEPLISYGVVRGDLDVSEKIVLYSLAAVRNDGIVEHPYQYTNDEGFARTPVQVNNTTVINVQYGNQPPIPRQKDFKQSPPKGYTHPTLPPAKPEEIDFTPDPQHPGVSKFDRTKTVAPANKFSFPPKSPSAGKSYAVSDERNRGGGTPAKTKTSTPTPAPTRSTKKR